MLAVAEQASDGSAQTRLDQVPMVTWPARDYQLMVAATLDTRGEVGGPRSVRAVVGGRRLRRVGKREEDKAHMEWIGIPELRSQAVVHL